MPIRVTIVLAIILGLQAQTTEMILHEGTPIRMKINRTISSADATQGQNVDFTTLDDIKLNDVVVIPKGSIAIATITEAESKRRMGRGGKLNMTIDYVRLVTGEKLPLRGIQDAKGGGHTGAMTGAMVATSIVFFPAAPLFLFMKGKDITIPEGHEVTVYTNTEYKVDPSKFPGGVPVKSAGMPKRTGQTLTNQDVLKMKSAGVSDDVILHKINTSPGNYTMNPDDVVSLKKAGLSDYVVNAMISASQQDPSK